MPTLSDYYDGVSGWAQALLADWKSARRDPSLRAQPPLVRPLPEEGLSPVPSRRPLSLANYRGRAPPEDGAAGGGTSRQEDCMWSKSRRYTSA